MKPIGAALVLVASLMAGFSLRGALSARIRTLGELEASLGIMAAEIGVRLTPMPEVLRLISRAFEGEAGAFYAEIAGGMDRLGEVSFALLWEEALPALKSLTPEDRAAVLELGASLGRYDAAAESAAVETTRARLALLRRSAEEKRAREGRLRLFLPVAAALFLVVLFI